MKLAMILLLILVGLALTACGKPKTFGDVFVPPLDSEFTTACLPPEYFSASRDYETWVRSMGVELILCDQRRAAVVAAYEGAAQAIAGR